MYLLQGNNNRISNPQIRSRREQFGVGVFLCGTVWAESGRLQCECVQYLCLYQCVFDQYILFLPPFSIWNLPVMYTYHDNDDVENLFLSFKDIKAQSHCLEMTTRQKRTKKSQRAYKKGNVCDGVLWN